VSLEPVRCGTAEQLARLAHFRALNLPEVDELDAVACFLIGDAGDSQARRELWEQLRDDAERLFHLITDDWDSDDLDELTERQCMRLPLVALEQEIVDARYAATRERLAADIEGTVRLARYTAAENRRNARTAVAS
jgi:hypothetical protein